jgi:putative flippase GtrA
VAAALQSNDLLGLTRLRGGRSARLLNFSVIGLICTGLYSLAYLALRSVASPIEANLLALSLTMTLNFAANRRYTFQAHGGRLLPQAFGYLLVYLVGLGASTLLLATSLALVSRPTAELEFLLALGSSFGATVVRFVLLSAWVFRGERSRGETTDTTLVPERLDGRSC